VVGMGSEWRLEVASSRLLQGGGPATEVAGHRSAASSPTRESLA